MTSFAFVFEDVPDPVWKTSSGNWSSSSPAATRSAAAAIRSALSGSSSPSSAFTRAAAALMRPSQRATEVGMGSPETVKLAIALLVSSPQSCFLTVCSAMNQSVEYFGWTFSPRIAAIALFAAIAASPMPTVISVILPG